MEWYNIIALILGAFGGTAGFISVYKAKPEKTSIEIKNMHQMLEDAHTLYNSAREEKETINKEFHDYKEEINEYVAAFKKRFNNIEDRLDQTERAILQGYRCPYPPKIEDCPVIKQYEKNICIECMETKKKLK